MILIFPSILCRAWVTSIESASSRGVSNYIGITELKNCNGNPFFNPGKASFVSPRTHPYKDSGILFMAINR